MQILILSSEQEEESSDYFSLYNNLIENNKLVYSFSNLLPIFENLTDSQFLELIWPFRFYDEIFDSGETENLEQSIKDSVDNLNTDLDFYESTIKQHKIFKNLLFNIKHVLYQIDNNEFKVMNYEDLQSLYSQENKFVIAKIGMSQKLNNSLNILGLSSAGESTGIAFSKHDVGYKYFILSSEPISFEEYLNLLPQSRDSEDLYINRFDDVDVDLPQFNTETEISFTYLKSNYVFQPQSANMSLKGVKEELSSTETSADIGVMAVNNLGY